MQRPSDAGPPSPHRYAATTNWTPWRALAAAALLTVAAFAVTLLVSFLLVMIAGGQSPGYDTIWLPMLAFQVALGGGAILLSGWYGSRRWHVMALDRDPPSWIHVMLYLALMGVVSIAYTLVIFSWKPEAVRGDLASFEPMIHSGLWPLYAVIMVVGAPLSEETLFRGFLQPALAQSALGFWGAGAVTTLAWAALHFQYSIYGLIEIVAVGLALTWVLRRTGSLWSTIAIHGLYNGAQLIGTALRLFPWT